MRNKIDFKRLPWVCRTFPDLRKQLITINSFTEFYTPQRIDSFLKSFPHTLPLPRLLLALWSNRGVTSFFLSAFRPQWEPHWKEPPNPSSDLQCSSVTQNGEGDKPDLLGVCCYHMLIAKSVSVCCIPSYRIRGLV